MAQKSQLKPTPIVYEVGVDVSVETYNDLVRKVGDWFAKKRRTKDPASLAKLTIDACLKGVKPSDPSQVWSGAETATFAKRIRMACTFDMETMTPLVTASDLQKEKKDKEKAQQEKKKKAHQKDDNYPKEYHQVTNTGDLSYGDDPRAFFTPKELERRDYTRDGLLKQFPQIDNIAYEGDLNMLLDLMLLQERLRFRALQSEKKNEVADVEYKMQSLTKQIVELKKAMGIHADQLAKLQKDKEGGSIGDAVRRLAEMGGYEAMRQQAFLEELILIFQMYITPSPRTDMEGYQLDDIGLYGLTKTRLVHCPNCGEENWAGINIREIEAYLVEKGALKPRTTPGPLITLPAYVESERRVRREVVDADD